MADDIFARGLAHYRERAAVDFGCDLAAFDSHQLTVVRRPAESAEKYIMVAMTLGSGTVVTVDEAWLDFVRGVELKKHFDAFQAQSMLIPVVDEARRRGIEVVARNPNLGFLLSAARVVRVAGGDALRACRCRTVATVDRRVPQRAGRGRRRAALRPRTP